MKRLLFALLGVVAIVAWHLESRADDWPQFHGPNRDNLCAETGLLQQWPDGGPKLLWTLKGLGKGYSTVSIVDGTLYTMGDRPTDDGNRQFVLAFDLATRKELWACEVGDPHRDGPRCTPTVDGDLVFALGTSGDLVCVEAKTGKLRWKKSLVDDFGGRMMSVWRFSESPLVDGEKVVCTPGAKDALLVALNKQTGETIWKTQAGDLGPAGKDGAGYCSIVPATIEGARQYVTLVGRGAVGVDAETGKLLWHYNRIANSVANITCPVIKDNLIFVTTSYKTGCALIEIKRQGDTFTAQEVYFYDYEHFNNHHGGVVLVGDSVYGGSGQNKGILKCLDLKTGKILWEHEPLGERSAAVLYADGCLYFRYERGTVALVAADPTGFRLLGQFKAPVVDGPAWPHPVISDGKLYLRANDTLMCYEVSN
ncbi:MAG: polyvinylalcohol dehydrogenase [Planctomycetota bacterium]|nr:MAG: polyvinylalcohol dehydrogenase [Planctomycetota bacterium]